MEQPEEYFKLQTKEIMQGLPIVTESHPDSHYLFNRNEHCREFCTLFKADLCIVSMANYEHHDFPVPKYLLSASGKSSGCYLVLSKYSVYVFLKFN